MNLANLKKLNLPDSPGVYFFRKHPSKNHSDPDGEILYIGKATSLRDRVKSYFSNDLIKTRGRLLVDMIAQAETVTYKVTDSVLEAFILETELIKEHQPLYNTKEKDNKSFNYVVFTKEDFPRVLVVRGRNLKLANQSAEKQTEILGFEYTDVFGPYPFGAELREAMRIIRRIFPFRDKCNPYDGPKAAKARVAHDGAHILDRETGKGRPCFNRTINLCPGVCAGEMTKAQYTRRINDLRLFFQGKKEKIVKDLEKRMHEHAKLMEFELANDVKKTLYALSHIKDISMIKKEAEFGQMLASRAEVEKAILEKTADATKTAQPDRPTIGDTFKAVRVEAYDVAHISGTSNVGVMVVMNDSEFDKNEYRIFNIKLAQGGDDIRSLEEMLKRRFSHPEWVFPDAVVIDGGPTHIKHAYKILNEILRDEAIGKLDIVSVVKDTKHKAREVMRLATDKGLVSNEDAVRLNAECHRFALKSHTIRRSKNLFNN